MGRHGNRAIYWVAEPTSALDQLRSFSQALYNHSHPELTAPLEFSYATWEQALQQAAILARDEPLALFIDEVTYLVDVNPSITGTFQKVWDHHLSKSQIILALSGSQMGMMRSMLAYEAPLYGRATAQLRLPPLPFEVTREFFPDCDASQRVTLYSIFGGIPAYWERLDQSASIPENIREQLLTSNTLMQEEPRLLLQDFINDPHNYVAIMRAIAHGAQTHHLISKHTGLSKGHISKYLSVLRDTGFVERQVPITENAAASRRGRYYITDPYLRFYYRFLSAYTTQLALGEQQKAMQSILDNMNEFIELYMWPELCQEWLLRASVHEQLPFVIQDVGRAWQRTHYFDAAGINSEESTIALGTCLWEEQPGGVEALKTLVEKAGTVIPKQGKWEVYFLGFANHGWDDEAQAYAAKVIREGKKGKNWHSTGLRLVDLEQVDNDLAHWAMPEREQALLMMAD